MQRIKSHIKSWTGTAYTFKAQMDQLGSQGWELVFANRARNGSTMIYECIFKRSVCNTAEKEVETTKDEPNEEAEPIDQAEDY